MLKAARSCQCFGIYPICLDRCGANISIEFSQTEQMGQKYAKSYW